MYPDGSVPLGEYWRGKPLVFSLVLGALPGSGRWRGRRCRRGACRRWRCARPCTGVRRRSAWARPCRHGTGPRAAARGPVERVLPLRQTFPVRLDTPTAWAAWVKFMPPRTRPGASRVSPPACPVASRTWSRRTRTPCYDSFRIQDVATFTRTRPVSVCGGGKKRCPFHLHPQHCSSPTQSASSYMKMWITVSSCCVLLRIGCFETEIIVDFNFPQHEI